MAKKSKAKAAKKATSKASKGARSAKKAVNKGAKRGAKTRARASATTSARKGAKKSAKKSATKAARRGAKSSATRAKRPASRATKTAKAARPAAAPPGKRPNLERERRTVQEDVHGVPSSLNMDRTASAARSGRAELEQRLRNHTSTGPAMTGGDVDADWEDAATVGDEAPGGDNPTPDQDVVDEIGRAMGIEYEDDEELKGGDELTERDRHRWELDPASKDDFEEE